MKEATNYERLLRWYPAAWRERYGQGLSALLEDTYGERPLPLRVRLSLALAGTVERAREVGAIGDTANPGERLRAGSLLVLCGWTLFLVAGTAFAKFTEHWSIATPPVHRTLPTIADTAVQVAGVVSAIGVFSAALFAVPAFRRLVRTQGWAPLRHTMLRALISLVVSGLLGTGLILWAHRLNVHQRNGGQVLYGVGAAVTGVIVVATIAVVTSTVIAVTRKLDFSPRVLRVLSSLALSVTLSMGVVAADFGLWWASESIYAPHVLANSFGSGFVNTSTVLPPTLVIGGLLMVIGLTSAIAGSARVIGGLKRT